MRIKSLPLVLILLTSQLDINGGDRVTTTIATEDLGIWALLEHHRFLNCVEQNLFKNKISAINEDGQNVMEIVMQKADIIFQSTKLFDMETNLEDLKQQEFKSMFDHFMYDSITINKDSFEFNFSYILAPPELSHLNINLPKIKISKTEIFKVIDEDMKLYLKLFSNNGVILEKNIHAMAIKVIENYNQKLRKIALSGKHTIFYNDSMTSYFNSDTSIHLYLSNKFHNNKASGIDSTLIRAKYYDSISGNLPQFYLTLETKGFEFLGISADRKMFFSEVYIGRYPLGFIKVSEIRDNMIIDYNELDLILRKVISVKLDLGYADLLKGYNSVMGLEEQITQD